MAAKKKRINKKAADKAVNFFKGLKHTKGQYAGKPFILAKWQEKEIIRPLFGTLRKDGTRQYRTAHVEVSKKNGKSELAAGAALYLLTADKEPGAEVYGAATPTSVRRIRRIIRNLEYRKLIRLYEANPGGNRPYLLLPNGEGQ